MRRRRRFPPAAGFGAGFLFVVLVLALAVFQSSSLKTIRPQLLDLPGDSPLLGGTETSLAQASASVSFPVFFPESSLASDSSAKAVWTRTVGLPEVLVDYQSGVRVTFRVDDFAPDPVEYYKSEIADGIPGAIVSLDGATAFVVSQDAEGDLGSVSMVINGVYVAVIGMGNFTDSQLSDVATSIVKASQAVQIPQT
ncbi:MAG: hypothetical protein ACXWEG_04015 [Actinomycetota bacterium]